MYNYKIRRKCFKIGFRTQLYYIWLYPVKIFKLLNTFINNCFSYLHYVIYKQMVIVLATFVRNYLFTYCSANSFEHFASRNSWLRQTMFPSHGIRLLLLGVYTTSTYIIYTYSIPVYKCFLWDASSTFTQHYICFSRLLLLMKLKN